MRKREIKHFTVQNELIFIQDFKAQDTKSSFITYSFVTLRFLSLY